MCTALAPLSPRGLDARARIHPTYNNKYFVVQDEKQTSLRLCILTQHVTNERCSRSRPPVRRRRNPLLSPLPFTRWSASQPRVWCQLPSCVCAYATLRAGAGWSRPSHHLFCVVLCDARVCPGVSAHTKNGEGQSPAARPPTPGAQCVPPQGATKPRNQAPAPSPMVP